MPYNISPDPYLIILGTAAIGLLPETLNCVLRRRRERFPRHRLQGKPPVSIPACITYVYPNIDQYPDITCGNENNMNLLMVQISKHHHTWYFHSVKDVVIVGNLDDIMPAPMTWLDGIC